MSENAQKPLDGEIYRQGPRIPHQIDQQLHHQKTSSFSDQSVISLELTCTGNHLNISIIEKQPDEESTLHHYETIAFDEKNIDERCKRLVQILNEANRQGRDRGQLLSQVREVGQTLYDELLSYHVKEKINNTRAQALILRLDDRLVHIPWELLNDGKHFLCMRFSMGRVIRTRQAQTSLAKPSLFLPLTVLVVADPTGDLKSAYSEGTQILDLLDQSPSLTNTTLRTDYISAETFKTKLRNYDLIHFAGHAEYDQKDPGKGGWRLLDSMLKTEDITRMVGTTKMPTLIFANACQSARTKKWVLNADFEQSVFGMANSFLLAGVKHYIGTFWEILDEPGSHFAIAFYKQLLSGNTVGKAVLSARHAIVDLYGEETILWASYVLYGDPTFTYLNQKQNRIPQKNHKKCGKRTERTEDKTRETIIDFGENQKKAPSPVWLSLAVIVLIFLAGVWGVSWHKSRTALSLEERAYANFLSGDYENSIQLCQELERYAPDRFRYALIQGNILLSQGRWEEAEGYFRKVIEAHANSDKMRSEALQGLGRLSSINDRMEEALGYYRQAAGVYPENVQAVVSQAVLLEKQGRFEDAYRVYRSASSIEPASASINSAADQLAKRLAFREDEARQKRIDRLIQEILDQKTKVTTPHTSKWSSSPLTAWLMEFQTSGFSVQEGTIRLAHGLVLNALLQDKRIQLVEREFLDRLLFELKLRSSQLADSDTALSVGRLAAARIVLISRLYFLQGQLNTTSRIIECETGVIVASITNTFKHQPTPEEIAGTLTPKIIEKIRVYYPIRAQISARKNNMALIDVGLNVGIVPGMTLKEQGGDTTVIVRSVAQSESEIEIISGNSDLHPGSKLEEYQQLHSR